MNAEPLELRRPPAPNIPRIFRERGPERLHKLITHPLRFRELHGTEMLSPQEARRMSPRRITLRRAIYLVGCAFMKHADFLTWRVGTPRTDGFVTPPGQEADDGFCDETGLPIWTLRRAIAAGIKAGYWTAHQPRQPYDGPNGEKRYAAFRVVYTLTDVFWRRLGLLRRMRREQTKAYRRASGRRRIYAATLLEARARVKRIQPRTPRGVPLELGGRRRPTPDQAENDARRLIRLELRFRELHPDWGPERIRAEARRLLQL